MKAIMLAAGEGTRGYPFTFLYPKMFQQVGGIPLLEYMLSWFEETSKIDKLYIVVRNDIIAETLGEYVQKRKPYRAEIVNLFARLGYCIEAANPDFEIQVLTASGWGTGGDLGSAIRQIAPVDDLGADFLVCYADYIVTRKLASGKLSPQLNLSDIISYHESCKKALGTVMTLSLVVVDREMATRFGVAQLQEVAGFQIIRSFMEKPGLKDIPQKPPINAGVYVMDRDYILAGIDEYLPARPDTSLERNLVASLARSEKPMLAGYGLDLCAWFDVGKPEQLIDANVYVTSRKGR